MLLRWLRSLTVLSIALVCIYPLISSAEQFSLFGRVQLNQGGPGQAVAADFSGKILPISMTGPAPQALPVPANMFTQTGTQFRVFPPFPSVAQVLTTFTTTQPSAALMAAGDGPGSFQFCPFPGNPINPACTNPQQATGGRNGLLIYNAGGNQFGGTFSIFRSLRSVVSFRIATAPLQFSHQAVTRTKLTWINGPALSFSHSIPANPGEITQSPVLGPLGSILTAGPKVGTGPIPVPQLETGFPFTTGRVVMKDDATGPATFTLTGFDNRDPNTGLGEIQLLAGGLGKAGSGTGAEAPRFASLRFVVPEPSLGVGIVTGFFFLASLMRAGSRKQQHIG